MMAPGLRTVLNALVEASNQDANSQSDMFVKILPPVHIRVVLPPSMVMGGRNLFPSSAWFSSIGKLVASSRRSNSGVVNNNPSSKTPAPSSASTSPQQSPTRFETFSSAWTSLVSDPILSKWIMLMLCLSVVLNGYLLRGIAAGLVGSGVFGERMGIGGFKRRTMEIGGQVGGQIASEVRFADGVKDDEEEEEEEKRGELSREIPEVVQPAAPQERPSPLSLPVPAPATFTLTEVDIKLRDGKKPHSRLVLDTPPATSSEGSSLSPSDNEDSASPITATPPMVIRSLEECIDIFENGPRPLSASLAMLNDEEVILLVQNGKIAAYALEKVLGGGAEVLEKAVRVRRALICESFPSI